MTEYNGHPLECFCNECTADAEPVQGIEHCYGKIVCPNCGRDYGICTDQQIKESESMINRNQPASSGQQQRRGGGRERGGLPFLKITNVAFDKKTAKVLSTRMESDNFKPDQEVVSVKIAYNSATYLWTLRMNNPNLDILIDAWGPEESKWIGKEFLLFLETDEHTNNSLIRAEVPAEERKPKRG